MSSITLGPLALPVPPLVLLAALFLASWLAERLAPADHRQQAGRAMFDAAFVGLAAARLAHVVLSADLYLADPLSVFDIRDGGWHATSGWLAAGAWLAWRGRAHPARRRPVALAAAAGFVLWAAASVLLLPAADRRLPPIELQAYESGQPASLVQAAGGRPVVVNLWASWCGPCRQEMPVLAAAQQRDPTVGFLFVNQGESAPTVRSYLVDQGWVLREVWLDPRSQLGPAIGSRGLPTTLFVDAHGRIVDSHVGAINAPGLETKLRKIRAQLPP